MLKEALLEVVGRSGGLENIEEEPEEELTDEDMADGDEDFE